MQTDFCRLFALWLGFMSMKMNDHWILWSHVFLLVVITLRMCNYVYSHNLHLPKTTPPLQKRKKESLKETLSLLESFLSMMIPCQCVSSGRWNWVTADEMWPSGWNTNEAAEVCGRVRCVYQSAEVSVFVLAFWRPRSCVWIIACLIRPHLVECPCVHMSYDYFLKITFLPSVMLTVGPG